MTSNWVFLHKVCWTLPALLLLACSTEAASSGAGGEGGGPGSGPGDGEDACCTLGAVCHVAGEPPSAEVEECHELGHSGDQAACTEQYDHCRDVCEGVTDEPVMHACQ